MPQAEAGASGFVKNLISPGGFPGDSAFHSQEPGVDSARIDAPAGGQQRDFVDVQRRNVRLAEAGRFEGFEVTKALEIEFLFGRGWGALVPNRAPGPRIGADNTAGVRFDPGVVMQNAAGAEELDLAQAAAQFEHKSKADIDVLARVGQA